MAMDSRNPNSIHYACVAKDTTILAEFNPSDADLGALAAKCLEKTPPLHSMLSHTVRDRSYSLLIDDSFVYFGVFGVGLANWERVSFLNGVKDAFREMLDASSDRDPRERPTLHCYQGEFSPVFRRLLAEMFPSHSQDSDGLLSPTVALKHRHRGFGGNWKRFGPFVLLEDAVSRWKRTKMIIGSREARESLNETGCEGEGDCGSREFPETVYGNGLLGGELGHHRAKRQWRRHALLVLSMDVLVCFIMLVIWLCICRGFKCMKS